MPAGYTPQSRLPLRRRANLTTGQVAAVAGLSLQTVIRLIDAGDLPGFRIPLSRFRRVTPDALAAWAERKGITLNWPAEIPQEKESPRE